MIDLVAVKDFLEDQLGRKVDVVTRGGLEPAIRDRVLRDAELCSDGERPGDLYPPTVLWDTCEKDLKPLKDAVLRIDVVVANSRSDARGTK